MRKLITMSLIVVISGAPSVQTQISRRYTPVSADVR